MATSLSPGEKVHDDGWTGEDSALTPRVYIRTYNTSQFPNLDYWVLTIPYIGQ